ncbi:nicotinamide n-methyltransferase [Ceratobasidium sp. UAMH 11750]|nr:nicotinamide n-methyltransferase [Ceratobasidium sp. UAMH 11750]
MTTDEDLSLGDVFEEPPRPPTPPPTLTTYHRKPRSSSRREWTSVDLQLVGHHVLWAQHLCVCSSLCAHSSFEVGSSWNAAIVLADFLDARSAELCEDKSVLELGAGGALPSLVAALCGARQVVITDYPDAPLIDNITRNVDRNIKKDMRRIVRVEGYIWGTDPRKLFDPIGSAANEDGVGTQTGFDVIILSDLIFNHSQHAALLDTCQAALRPPTRPVSHAEKPPGMPVLPVPGCNRLKQLVEIQGSRENNPVSLDVPITCPCVLVFFSHHRPQYAARDLEFFALARSRGWVCEKVVETKMPVMFPDDPGDEQVRSTVHGWVLRQNVKLNSPE